MNEFVLFILDCFTKEYGRKEITVCHKGSGQNKIKTRKVFAHVVANQYLSKVWDETVGLPSSFCIQARFSLSILSRHIHAMNYITAGYFKNLFLVMLHKDNGKGRTPSVATDALVVHSF